MPHLYIQIDLSVYNGNNLTGEEVIALINASRLAAKDPSGLQAGEGGLIREKDTHMPIGLWTVKASKEYDIKK